MGISTPKVCHKKSPTLIYYIKELKIKGNFLICCEIMAHLEYILGLFKNILGIF
jgi:hypothetical protein